MTWQRPSKAEFDANWLSPEEALDLLCDDRIERPHWERYILDRLKAGLFVAVGRTGNPKGKLEDFPPILPSYWGGWDDVHSHFWLTGDAKFQVGGTTGYGDWRDVHYFDIRLDPGGFNGRIPDEGPPPEAESAELTAGTKGKPPLSDAKLHAWAALFNEANPGASEAMARRSVAATFPNNHVTVEKLRRVLPDRPPGRPRKT